MADVNFAVTAHSTVEITNNTTKDLSIQLYRVNLWTVVPAGEKLVLSVGTSEEVAYYDAICKDSKGLMYPTEDGTPAFYNDPGLLSFEFKPGT